jgi:hypothetical protein
MGGNYFDGTGQQSQNGQVGDKDSTSGTAAGGGGGAASYNGITGLGNNDRGGGSPGINGGGGGADAAGGGGGYGGGGGGGALAGSIIDGAQPGTGGGAGGSFISTPLVSIQTNQILYTYSQAPCLRKLQINKFGLAGQGTNSNGQNGMVLIFNGVGINLQGFLPPGFSCTSPSKGKQKGSKTRRRSVKYLRRMPQ